MNIDVAIEDFMGDVRDRGNEDSTLDKYTTLMDQLQAFCDDKGITYIQHFGQDEMKQFRRDWEDENAAWTAMPASPGPPLRAWWWSLLKVAETTTKAPTTAPTSPGMHASSINTRWQAPITLTTFAGSLRLRVGKALRKRIASLRATAKALR